MRSWATFSPTSVWGIRRQQWESPSVHEGEDVKFNLVVDDLDGALRHVAEAGAELAGEPESFSYGRFGWFIDPDGNKVELWEPSGTI
ncbi:VOC family protein [Massilia cavernae]|uniref:VOC family protein n=1 Tax=Massilia cavernae TaxID=2320864 RepID=UPI0016043899|nr:VOC family protein [Massilia cavernae]